MLLPVGKIVPGYILAGVKKLKMANNDGLPIVGDLLMMVSGHREVLPLIKLISIHLAEIQN